MSKEEGHELEITELRLGLPGGASYSRTETKKKKKKKKKKRAFFHMGDYAAATATSGGENRVVGWPPVCSYRQRTFSGGGSGGDEKVYVKVSVDGAPFLRKIDLSTHQGYEALVAAFEKLFGLRFGEVLKEGDNSEYVPIYEDRDGDWMLLGDVPWEMFIESCKRLRIMKRSEASGFGLEPKGYLKGVYED